MITPDINTPGSAKLSKRALILSLLLISLCLISLVVIICRLPSSRKQLTAYIYQNGQLFRTINLSEGTSDYTFTVIAEDGGHNEISVKPGEIGITDADCPDKLCVSMGYVDSSLLPIVCLPHSLVIHIKETSQNAPDIMTY
ncbi:MAG TPA: NusG domain II-containing protein [Lachnospiraceae bacterium]|nr:NusG domain II-containing protein [Lachnospiraceae bacterium]